MHLRSSRMNAAEIKEYFLLALPEGLDKPLEIHSFVRGRNSLVFVRKGPGFRREFDADAFDSLAEKAEWSLADVRRPSFV